MFHFIYYTNIGTFFPDAKKQWHSLSRGKQLILAISSLLLLKILFYLLLVHSINWQQKLFEAARDGNVGKAKRALFFRAKIDHVAPFGGRNWSPRSHAIINCRPGIIRLFAAKGASMNYQLGDDHDWTHSSTLAIMTDDPATIEAFIAAGGALGKCTAKGDNPFTYAIRYNKKQAAAVLSHHMDINLTDEAGFLPLTLILAKQDTVERDAWYTHLDSLGMDKNATDMNGNTAVYQMFYKIDKTVTGVALAASIVWIAKRNKGGIDLPNKMGMTPLMYAANSGNGKAMNALTKNGASMLRTNKYGKNAFHILDYKGHSKLFQQHAKRLKKKDPIAFKALKKQFPHRINANGKVLKKPLPKSRFAKRSTRSPRRYKRRGKSGVGRKLLRRLGPVGFFLSFF